MSLQKYGMATASVWTLSHLDEIQLDSILHKEPSSIDEPSEEWLTGDSFPPDVWRDNDESVIDLNQRVKPQFRRLSAQTVLEASEPSVSVRISTMIAIKNAVSKTAIDAKLSSATAKFAYITVYNQSSSPQSFALLASKPTFIQSNKETTDGLRIGVYQSSRRVAAETGSYTFSLPTGPPLSWADPFSDVKSVVIVTGRTRRKTNNTTQKLFSTDYVCLATRETANRRCKMTMPTGDEPRFATTRELGSWAQMPRPNMEDGTVDIHVATTFDTNQPDRPFLGIGAPDPYYPHIIIPVCTWDAQPGALYTVKPKTSLWKVVRTAAEPGDVIEPDIMPTLEAKFDSSQPLATLYFNNSNVLLMNLSDGTDI